MADLVAVEWRTKLDAPWLPLGFDRLFVSDMQGRVRAYQSKAGGGMDAAQLAGLT